MSPKIANAQITYCWVNSATGKPVTNVVPDRSRPGSDDNHRSIPSSQYGPGADYVRTPDGSWINAATGQSVTNLVPDRSRPGSDDNHRSIPSSQYGVGADYVRVPCPPPQTTSTTPSTSIQYIAGVEAGGAGARAFYDFDSIEPRSWAAGGYFGARVILPGNWFIGGQVGAFGTDLKRDISPGFNVGLEAGIPFDAQVGTTAVTPFSSMPVTIFGFAGPMIGFTRTATAASSEHFMLFGGTIGAGAELNLGNGWAITGRVRYFNLGPGEKKSEGQSVEGFMATGGVAVKF